VACECEDDPYAFVMGAFPWLTPGTSTRGLRWADALGQGPDGTHRLGLLTIDGASRSHPPPVTHRKSTTVAQLVLWAFITFPDSFRGVVTANTEIQLKTKTWAELGNGSTS